MEYDYECPKCKIVKQVDHSIADIGKIKIKCPECKSTMKKIIYFRGAIKVVNGTQKFY